MYYLLQVRLTPATLVLWFFAQQYGNLYYMKSSEIVSFAIGLFPYFLSRLISFREFSAIPLHILLAFPLVFSKFEHLAHLK